MNRRRWLWCAGAAVIAGCATVGEPFRPTSVEQPQAVIYVYRPYHFGGSLLHPTITCGDQTARVGPGGYHAFVVAPGAIQCSAETDKQDVVELDIAPGSVNYIKEEIGWGIMVGHPHLYPMDSDDAQSEIQSCCKLEP
jgi:hypothetical protein